MLYAESNDMKPQSALFPGVDSKGFYGVARGVMEGGLSVGMVLTYSAYFNTLREASMDMTDRVQTMIERTSNLGRMMPL